MNPSITIEGLTGAQKALIAFGGGSRDSKIMNKAIVDKLLVPQSKVNAPKRSGRLAASVRSDSSALYGFILAGARGSVEYAGVIHYGHSTRGLGRKASGSTLKERRTSLQTALATDKRSNFDRSPLTNRAINKAARGRQRGGPIKPQPFIYEAIDDRREGVFREYEEQLEQRARIEGLL